MLNDSALDRTFQALADPVRRGMLVRLARSPASVSQLAEPLSISLPAVLQHLKALEASGLVTSRKQGRVRTVRLEPTALSAAAAWIAERRAEWEAQLDRFEDYLAMLQSKESERDGSS
ncbi:metalloregulator ArsR/SmtB family transcription factor [Geminicoccaceae bacterium 1502E]|nr:metalloregulator ArsR/SmtB family transcription factor [Geminicoccaceae bacterium 1502E]